MEQLLQEVEKQSMETVHSQEMAMDPKELLIRLYASAIRNVEEAIWTIDHEDIHPDQLLSLGRAYWIIEYFIDSLDFHLAPELCRDLEGLYHSMMKRMTQAYAEMSSAPLIPVRDALTELHKTWEEAIALAAVSETEKIEA